MDLIKDISKDSKIMNKSRFTFYLPNISNTQQYEHIMGRLPERQSCHHALNKHTFSQTYP